MYRRNTNQDSARYLNSVLGFGLLTPEREREAFKDLNKRRTGLSRLLRRSGLSLKEAREAVVGLENGTYTLETLMDGVKSRILRKRRREIRQAIRDLLRARTFIVHRNTRLVASIAHQYTGRGIELEDLIQEGNVGLLKAVERFDASRGFKFSTYATWWIRQTISRSLENHSRFVRLPVNVKSTLDQILRATESLTKEFHRQPTVEEIGERIDVAPERVRQLLRFGDRAAISLDAPIREDGEANLSELIPSGRYQLPVDKAESVLLKQKLHEAMEGLSDTERYVLKSRFGLEGAQHKTLKDIGSEFSLSRERIRQIEMKALKKLQGLLESASPERN
jgi:RNA polymerase primary sigma factor